MKLKKKTHFGVKTLKKPSCEQFIYLVHPPNNIRKKYVYKEVHRRTNIQCHSIKTLILLILGKSFLIFYSIFIN